MIVNRRYFIRSTLLPGETLPMLVSEHRSLEVLVSEVFWAPGRYSYSAPHFGFTVHYIGVRVRGLGRRLGVLALRFGLRQPVLATRISDPMW